eukprot:TRINITY_DN2415_c0_g1_i1.p1 TRINITY_DN2415_c0_g1~~TRINITY_DN2415_c0_g1_i1.p1  ORF type:complete len:363 (-),score=149.51 TRINITY_DN2415_c0_g1_i1:303-1319(-)
MGNSMASCYAAEVEVQEGATQAEAKALETSDKVICEEEKEVEKVEAAMEEKEEKPVETAKGPEPEPTDAGAPSSVEATEPVMEVAEALTTNPSVLVITFEAKGTGKETELVFKTQPLPFDCKAEAAGKCFCSGKSGRVAVKKVDSKKAQEFYDLKPGMLIKKLDGVELSKDLDWPEFQKTLAAKTKELKLEEVPKEVASKEKAEQKATVESTEVSKEATVEAAEEAVQAPKTTSEEAAKESAAETSKETAGDAKEPALAAVKEEATETLKDAAVEAAKEVSAEAEEAKETTVEAAKEEATEAPKETAVEAIKEASAEASKEATGEVKETAAVAPAEAA